MQEEDFAPIVDFGDWSQTPLFNMKGSAMTSAVASSKVVGVKQPESAPTSSSLTTEARLLFGQQLNEQIAQQLRNIPVVYEQALDSKTQNRYAFLRSFKYFNMLISGQPDDPSFSLNSDTVVDPMRLYRKQTNVCKGLFCGNRECCSLILDVLGRSPYCCKSCQIREQNMRQGRVKSRHALIRRKEALFCYLVRLGEDEFERGKIITTVGAFLAEYGEQFGEL